MLIIIQHPLKVIVENTKEIVETLESSSKELLQGFPNNQMIANGIYKLVPTKCQASYW